MKIAEKTQERLNGELEALRLRIAKLKRAETERRQAEEALQQSNRRFKDIAQNALEWIWEVDAEGKYTYTSAVVEKILGYKPNEVLGKYFYDLFHPDDREELKKAAFEVFAKKRPFRQFVNRNIHKNGEVVWLSTSGVPILDKEENFLGYRGADVDITESKQAEEALRESEAYNSSLLENVPNPVIVTNPDTSIRYVNPAMEKLTGYTADEVIGQKPPHPWWFESQTQEFMEKIRGMISKGGLSEEEVLFHKKNGEQFWVNVNISVIERDGEVSYALGNWVDITERRQAEEALQAEKNKLASVINALEYGLTIQDKDYNIIYQNELLRKLFGDRLGEKCYQVYEGKEKLCDGCPIEKAFRDGKSHTSERRVVLPSGKVTFWENTANPIRDAEGRVVSCLEITRNITERKRAEEALQKSQEELRQMFESVTDGISVIDLNGVITRVNQRTVKMHGFSSRDEVVGKSALELVAPRDHERVKTNMRKALKRGTIEVVEYTLLRADGSEFPGELSTSVLRDAAGNLVGHITIARDITERKQAEEELADEATWRRILVDQSRDGIVILDENGKVYEANRQFAEMLGYTPEEVDQLYVWDWEYLYPRERVLEMIRTVDEAGDHFETQHRRKDGTVYDVEISTNGAVVAGKKLVFCVCRDVTERKRAEEALLEAEEKYKNFVEATSDMLWESDEMGTFTFVSPRIKDILGYEVDEVVGKKRTLDFAPEEEKRKWLPRFKEVNAKKVPFFGFEITHIHKNGSPVVLETSGAPFLDSAGNFKGFVGINKNITERKQAEEALRESQKFSSSLLENSPNSIFVVNPDTSVKYVNPAFEKLTGFTLAEIIGRKAPYPWWPKEQQSETIAQLKNSMLTGGRRSEKVFRKKNGERFFVELSSAPIVHKGKLFYFLINWLDITGRKRAEEERQDLEQKAHLASRLASVGEMASGIAHEINNPLTAVIGFAQLLMDTDLPDEVKEDISVIHKEAQRAAGVARNLLTFARKHTPIKQPTNLNSIIEGVLKLRAYEQSVNNIKVNTRLAIDLPEVMADYSQMQQVFVNIILNAESAMLGSGNGGTMTITTQKVNNVVRASFADTGPGITKENLNRIFDPFFTTKEVGKGTGLGLSVCHGIVAEHGGRIYARGRLGNGATFVVELPVELPINAH
jgi:PAS domain S-box-containing protein